MVRGRLERAGAGPRQHRRRTQRRAALPALRTQSRHAARRPGHRRAHHRKIRLTPEQQAQSRATIRARGAEVGFDFAMDKRARIYNTFDAHRLLHWAGLEGDGAQRRLKHALFDAYFTKGEDPSSQETLALVAGEIGLSETEALAVLRSDRYADEVHERERFFLRHGINSVPAVIINQRHLISGGQPAAVFEKALRQILAEA